MFGTSPEIYRLAGTCPEASLPNRPHASDSSASLSGGMATRNRTYVGKDMLETSMRPEEAFRIRIENINFKQKTNLNPFGKTEAARRVIPMTDDNASLLKARVEKAEKKNSPFVFTSPFDIQKPIDSVKKTHRSAAERAGIEGHFRLYDLRHTFATRAVAAGTDLPTLSSLLGYTSILMTMRY
jgi:integrase